MKASLPVAVALTLVLGGALAALAEDGTTRLPFTPYANAREGDYTVSAVGSQVRTARVVAVASGSVTIERGGVKETLSTAQPPTVAAFLGRFEKSKITAFRVIDDAIDVGGLRIACRRLTFAVRTAKEHAHVSVWFSPDVKGSGIALVRVRDHEPGESVSEERLVEFGTSQGATWKKATEGERR